MLRLNKKNIESIIRRKSNYDFNSDYVENDNHNDIDKGKTPSEQIFNNIDYKTKSKIENEIKALLNANDYSALRKKKEDYSSTNFLFKLIVGIITLVSIFLAFSLLDDFAILHLLYLIIFDAVSLAILIIIIENYEDKIDDLNIELGYLKFSNIRLLPSQIRKFVYMRDKGKCVKCGASKKLSFYYDKSIFYGGSPLDPNNTSLLCTECKGFTKGYQYSRGIPFHIQRQVYNRDQGRCVNCGNPFNLHYDHVIPYSKGGSSTDFDNIQMLCEECNLRKKNLLIY